MLRYSHASRYMRGVYIHRVLLTSPWKHGGSVGWDFKAPTRVPPQAQRCQSSRDGSVRLLSCIYIYSHIHVQSQYTYKSAFVGVVLLWRQQHSMLISAVAQLWLCSRQSSCSNRLTWGSGPQLGVVKKSKSKTRLYIYTHMQDP